MAKVFFTNRKNISDDNLNLCINQGFELSYKLSDTSLNLHTFYKKTIPEKNFYESHNNLITGIGSLIYKKRKGVKALELILSDFIKKKCVSAIRQNILGNYAICIKEAENYYFFNDATHSIPLYYFHNNQTTAIGNDLYDISKNLVKTEAVTLNEENFLEGVFQNAILGPRTFFNEIKKLLGHELIHYDSKQNSLNVSSLETGQTWSLNTATKKIQVKEYSGLLLDSVIEISEHYKKIGIFMTGGLDSRVTLAAFLKAGIKPKLLYGIGDSAITNTKVEDYNIVKEIAKKYDLELITMNWGSPDPIDKYWKTLPEKYGFFTDLYSGTKNVIDAIEQIKDIDFVEFGYMGESIRSNKWIDDLDSSPFAIQQLVGIYQNKYNIGIIKNPQKINQNILSEFTSISFRKLNSISFLTKDHYQIFDNEYRKLSDVQLLNFVNQYISSISVGGQAKLIDYTATIPYSYKKDNSFSIGVIEFLQRDLLNLPILTHGKPLIISHTKGIKAPAEKKQNGMFEAIKVVIMRKKAMRKMVSRLKLFLVNLIGSEKNKKKYSGYYIINHLSKNYKVYNNEGIKNIAYASSPYVARFYLMRTIIEKILKK